VGQSGGRPWWFAASKVNATTPTTEVTKVDESAAGAALAGGCPSPISRARIEPPPTP